MTTSRTFWTDVDSLVASSTVVIDRARGSGHPRSPEHILPARLRLSRGNRVGRWAGYRRVAWGFRRSSGDGVLSTIDLLKRDIEIKLLLGCSLPRLTKFRRSSSGWKCGSCCRSEADKRRLAHATQPGSRYFLKYPALEA